MMGFPILPGLRSRRLRTVGFGLAGVVLLSLAAAGQDESPLIEGRPGASTLSPAERSGIEPIYSFPPNCLPIIGLPGSGINRLLANVSGEDLRIVVLAELSGRHAALGRAWRDGIALAAELANAKGGIMGRQIVLDMRDVGDDSAGVESVAGELLREPPFALFGPLNEGAAKAVVDIMRRSQTPLMLGTVGLDLQNRQEAWLSRGLPTPLSRLFQLADHAREEYKARSAALIWAETDYGRSRREVLIGAFRRRSLQLVVDAGATPQQSGFEDILARIRANAPDVLFLMLHGEHASRLLTELRRQGFDKPILIDGDVVDGDFLAAAGQNANGLRGIAGLYAGAPVARVRTMAERFERRFGYRSSVPAVNGFVAFNVLKAGVERACSFNSADLFKAWRNMRVETRNDPGVLMDMRLDWSRNLMRDEFVFEIRNGAPHIVGLQRAPSAYN